MMSIVPPFPPPSPQRIADGPRSRTDDPPGPPSLSPVRSRDVSVEARRHRRVEQPTRRGKQRSWTPARPAPHCTRDSCCRHPNQIGFGRPPTELTKPQQRLTLEPVSPGCGPGPDVWPARANQAISSGGTATASPRRSDSCGSGQFSARASGCLVPVLVASKHHVLGKIPGISRNLRETGVNASPYIGAVTFPNGAGNSFSGSHQTLTDRLR
jgi:hypothetical protein